MIRLSYVRRPHLLERLHLGRSPGLSRSRLLRRWTAGLTHVEAPMFMSDRPIRSSTTRPTPQKPCASLLPAVLSSFLYWPAIRTFNRIRMAAVIRPYVTAIVLHKSTLL